MDYEKKIRDYMNSSEVDQLYKSMLSNLFPELVEPQEEKARRSLLEFLEDLFKLGKNINFDRWSKADCEEWVNWVMKQGEQKPEVKYVYTKFRIGDVIVEIKPNGYCQPVRVKYVGEESYSCESDDGKRFLSFPVTSQDEYKLVEQKHDDKVEPKFKVGDFITNDYCFGKVVALTNDAYLLDTEQGIPFSCEHNAHLWTIQDAKAGDVLAAHECLVLFKEIDGLNIRCYCTYHYLNHQAFYVDTLQNKTAFHPATKEQRDLLFKKMHEAGYEWDDKKLELKKVEQRPTEWTAEDEEELKIALNTLEEAGQYSSAKWLKNVCLVPQTKQEWSEEVESAIQLLEDIADEQEKDSCPYNANDLRIASQYLKFLRPQTTLKPSDEHYELEEFAKIVRGNLTGISKAVQKLFEAKYLQLTGNKMYGGFKD